MQTKKICPSEQLVRLTGARYSTLKFYTEEGMLPFEQAGEKLTRRYQREQSVQRIAWVKEMRRSGRSIPEIKDMVRQARDGGDSLGMPGNM